MEHLFAENRSWEHAFGAATLQRGRRYAELGWVRLVSEQQSRIEASCQGSGDSRYRQSITFSVTPARAVKVEGRCTCPVATNCKHCAAVLYTLAAGYEPAASGGHLLPHELEHWLQVLGQPPAPPPEDRGGRMLCYELILREDLSCAVRARKCAPQPEGMRYSRIHSLHELLYDPPRYVTQDDLRILRQLMTQNVPYGQERGYALKGREGGDLLQQIAATGRLLVDEGSPLLKLGAEREADFRWVRLESGQYRGLWHCADRPVKVLPLIPLFYLDIEAGEVGILQHSLDPHTAQQLSIAPEVPEHLIVPLSHKLKALNHQLPTPSSVTQEQVNDLQPVAHLTLGSVEFSAYMPKTGRMQRQLQHRAALAFDYDGIRASGTDDKPLSRLAGTTSQRIARQPLREKQLRETLRSLGFKAATRQSKALPDSAGEMYQLPDDEAWLHFAREALPKLREAGWHVEMQRDFAFDLQEVQDWYAHIEQAPAHEWFDLELGIVVDGQRHSLLPIMLQLLRSNPELLRPSELARRGDDEHLLLDLNRNRPEGTALRVALPYGRIKAVMGTLSELYLNEASSGPAVRLERADAARLNDLDHLPLQWEGGQSLRDLGRRLRDARDLQVTPPKGLAATLRPYQQQGLNWLQALREMGTGGILGDDMGLGKTLQTLAHLLLEKESGRLQRPALAVMPTSLIPNWLDEAQRFAPDLKVLALHGPGRSRSFAALSDHDLVLTTYALLPRDLPHLQPINWHLLVLDEAQNIKSSTSKAALAARELQADQRLCLTGTPMENNLGELWSIFHFLMPGWLGDQKRFSQDYRTPIERHGDTDRMAHLANRIHPFLLRRRKEQVAQELPAKTEMVHWVDLSDAQRDAYETVRVAMDKKVRDEISRNGAARSQIVILDALLRLRQVCCDLRLVKGAEAKGNQADKGKLGSLLHMLEELLDEGRRVLLFSQFTSMLALIQAELDARAIRYSLLTGDTRDRRTPVRQFQNGESEVFLISLKAGGTGLNLTAADTVIHYDPWWNPASENQATDRAYRIGQDKPVFVYKLITRGTVEEKIQHLQQEKAALAAGLLDGGQAGQWRLGDEEIEALFAPLTGKRAR
nr:MULTISPECIES: DEAD/DEAH box helicase [unclassified Pseudomonas]